MKIFRLLLIAFACIAAERLCRLATDGFAVAKMVPLSDGMQNYGTPPKELFSQRFHYLSKGGQCYVFASEDGNYVLKFFRKGKHLERTYKSLSIAARELSAETGLLYLHLARDELPPLHIVDKLQIAHTIDPNAYGFVLQQRAELVRPHLASLKRQEEVEEALAALFELVETIRAKGISDGDANLGKNFGFIEGRAVEIDLGGFDTAPLEPTKFKSSKEELLQWLNAHYPSLSCSS